MKTFVSVVENGGFSAAAARLGQSRAQVSKAVMQLEAHLGSRLLHRTTRRVGLTETGRACYERSLTILQDLEEMEAMTREQTLEPRGVLRLSAPTSFGTLYLNRLIPDYLELYPDVQVSLSLADRFVDAVAEGFDLVVRIAELEDSSLVARRIAPCRRVLCAAPDYLAKNGTPAVPQDLAIHHCLVYSNELKPDTWVLHGPGGVESVRVNGPVCADNGDALRAAAVAGLGVTLLPTFIVGPEIRQGRLQTVLDDYCPPDISINAVYPSRRFLSARVRTFIDFLSESFAGIPEWDAAT